eukprot:1992223-Rhodomonas_salina.3
MPTYPITLSSSTYLPCHPTVLDLPLHRNQHTATSIAATALYAHTAIPLLSPVASSIAPGYWHSNIMAMVLVPRQGYGYTAGTVMAMISVLRRGCGYVAGTVMAMIPVLRRECGYTAGTVMTRKVLPISMISEGRVLSPHSVKMFKRILE